MNNLINEFNTNALQCIDFIISVTNDSDLQFYKKAFDKIILVDNTKAIEQFIIHCLPHYQEIINKDEKYFINLKSSLNKTSLIEVLKLKKYFISLDNDVKNLIFEYLILLCNYSKQYLQSKLSTSK
jgi:hypothetical protein